MLFSPQLALRKRGGSNGTGGAVTDPNFSSVKLLMGFEGTNGSSGSPGMDDESSAVHGTATNHGSATISTAQKKFGASSLLVTGSSTQDLIHFADSVDWDLGSGQFTIECFIRPVALTGNTFLVSQWGSGTTHAWALWLQNDQLSWNVSTTGADNLGDLISSAGLLTTGTWYHVCVDHDASKYRMYIDGAMVASSATARTIFNSSGDLNIGGDLASLLFFYNGYIDELRVTKGVARYASDAGFTVPTGAFPRS